MGRIKNYKTLVSETLEVQNLEELESAGDLFQYGIEKGNYTLRQSQEYNSIYWRLKNQLICDSIKDQFKGFNKLDLLGIIRTTPVGIKDDTNALVDYIKGIIKNLRKKQKIA